MAQSIVCPDCGNIFKKPAMDQKRFGFGLTIPGMGLVQCPSCGARKPRKAFRIAEEGDYQKAQAAGKASQEASKPSESDLIEDSRYEDE